MISPVGILSSASLCQNKIQSVWLKIERTAFVIFPKWTPDHVPYSLGKYILIDFENEARSGGFHYPGSANLWLSGDGLERECESEGGPLSGCAGDGDFPSQNAGELG
jgi:hypothetical protein